MYRHYYYYCHNGANRLPTRLANSLSGSNPFQSPAGSNPFPATFIRYHSVPVSLGFHSVSIRRIHSHFESRILIPTKRIQSPFEPRHPTSNELRATSSTNNHVIWFQSIESNPNSSPSYYYAYYHASSQATQQPTCLTSRQATSQTTKNCFTSEGGPSSTTTTAFQPPAAPRFQRGCVDHSRPSVHPTVCPSIRVRSRRLQTRMPRMVPAPMD